MTALHRLRTRLGVDREVVAKALQIAVADVDTIERTPFRLLEVDALERYIGACGCRLDVVAVHRLDGVAHWLSDDSATEGDTPACPQCGLGMARYVGPDGRGWLCVRCAGDEP